MVRADRRVMQSLLTPEGQVIVDFLKLCRDVKDSECRQQEGNLIYRAQGAAQELDEIITLANNARDALEST